VPELPEVSESHRQEHEGDAAFIAAVPKDLFIARKENPDYGNDWVLELQVGSRASNYRAYCQLKTVTKPRRLRDGSVSFRVDLSNLRYLLNQQSSLVVLFTGDTKELLWVWARQISQRVAQCGVALDGKQKTFTYHFRRTLDREAFEEIHAKTLRTSALVSSVVDAVSTAQPGATLHLDPATGELLSSAKAAELLKRFGMWLANQGRYDEVERLLTMVSNLTADPELSLIASYANFRSGQHLQALTLLPRGKRLSQLQEGYMEIADYLKATLEYLVGLTSEAQYSSAKEALREKYPNGLVTLRIRLDDARQRVIEADRTEETYGETLGAYQRILFELQVMAREHPQLGLEVEFHEWELSGFLLLQVFLDGILLVEGNRAIGRPLPESVRETLARRTIAEFEGWHRQFVRILRASQGNPSFESTLRVTYARLRLLLHAQLEVFSLRAGLIDPDDDSRIQRRERALDELIESLRTARSLSEACHDYGGQLEADLAIAECMYAKGQKEEAFAVADEVKEEAEAIGASDIKAKADALLSGKAIFDLRHFIEDRAKRPIGEADIPKLARQFARIRGLPNDRLPNIEEGYRWQRDIEIERHDWCRHIGYRENLLHTRDPSTEYATSPPRKCICELHGHETPPSLDRRKTLDRLKAFYCLGCKDRSPLKVD